MVIICFLYLEGESNYFFAEGSPKNFGMSGQSVVDRLNAAKHSISGQGLAKSVCKASTEEVTGPKRKHLDCKLTKQS